MPELATRSARPYAAPAVPITGRWVAALRRGLDVLVAFATLRDAERDGDRSFPAGSSGAAPERRARAHRAVASTVADASHPHRRPLREPARCRRPGGVRHAPQACITPLTPKRLPRRRDPVADAHR